MPVLENAPTRVLGFDVAKKTIAVFDTSTRKARVIDNRGGAIDALLANLDGAGLDDRCLAVCEPTGGHERALLARLAAHGIPCHRADTLKVKAFIRSFGTLAKTDALDAKGLARYGMERWRDLPLFAPPDDALLALGELVARRRDLTVLKVAERNRLGSPARQAIKASCQAVLRTLERQIERIDAAIDALLETSEDLRQRIDLLQSVPGVGPRTATALAAAMPELGAMTRRQAASLAGVAPHPRDSGMLRGYRSMRGGRPIVRTALFMAALAASRAKGPLREFYQRLVKNGKKPIVAIAALMRKIIVILNAKLRDEFAKQS